MTYQLTTALPRIGLFLGSLLTIAGADAVWAAPVRHFSADVDRFFASPAQAMGLDRDEGRPSDESGLLPVDRAVSMVQTRFRATALKTDRIENAGQVLYRIRLISADRARVWTVTVDARSGQVY